MEVDGTVVDGRIRAFSLDEPEHGAGLRLDDRERVRRGRTQSELTGRIVPSGPDVAAPRLLQLRQQCGPLERLVAECPAVGVVDGRLERRRAHVTVEHTRVGVVENRRLDLAPEQRVWLAHEVLVERILARDQHGESMASASGTPPLLAQRCDCAGEADGDGAVEETDVDAELERVRRRDAEKLSFDEAPPDLSPLRGRVTRAVGREARARLLVDALNGEPVDQLGSLSAL